MADRPGVGLYRRANAVSLYHGTLYSIYADAVETWEDTNRGLRRWIKPTGSKILLPLTQ